MFQKTIKKEMQHVNEQPDRLAATCPQTCNIAATNNLLVSLWLVLSRLFAFAANFRSPQTWEVSYKSLATAM